MPQHLPVELHANNSMLILRIIKLKCILKYVAYEPHELNMDFSSFDHGFKELCACILCIGIYARISG